MTRQIKFTSFGIPYITEFENVSFLPEPPRHPSPSSSSSSFCYIESPPPQPRFPPLSLRSPSSFFRRKHTQHPPHTTEPPLWSPGSGRTTPPPHSDVDVSEAHGIYIQFPPEHARPQTSRKERLVHLQQTISAAVLNAGMSGSPGNTTHPHPEKHSNENTAHRTRGYKTENALFCGTYGQLMTALEAAGLSAIPCVGDALSGYTRLGAIFVARNDGASGVRLKKITLWG